mmetsp:Transcript_1957/g.4404  ORF Transcript_1957/g.4404 Transcript_1957/m.4404 type:complete len:492 (+) Transcript_1957:1679-3154(+)|eukprot:746392-Hanusia_phi.AAC.4
MQVCLHAGDESLVHRVLGERPPEGRGVLPDIVDDPVLLVRREQVGDVPSVEDGVDILDEALVDDLRVGEQEHHGVALNSRDHEQLLDVFSKLVVAVSPRQLDGDALVVGHEGREPRQTLLPRPSQPHQHRVPARRAEDAGEAGDVLDGVHEEDEVHGLGRRQVVLLQVRLHQLVQLLGVLYGLVVPVLRSHSHLEEVAEEDRQLLEGLGVVPVDAELLLEHLVQPALEQDLVLVVDEPILEDPLVLVAPQSQEGAGVGTVLYLQRQDPLEDLGQVSEVESVVTLSRRREHLRRDSLVDVDARVDRRLGKRLDVRREHRKVPVEDGEEDDEENGAGGRGDGEHREVPEEPVSHYVASSSRGPTGCDQNHVDDVVPVELLPVVKASKRTVVLQRVCHLPQQLDRGLSPVLLPCRHVDVINEADELLVHRRPHHSLPLLLETKFQHLLRARARRLRGEVDGEGDQISFHLPPQELPRDRERVEGVDDDDRFACA